MKKIIVFAIIIAMTAATLMSVIQVNAEEKPVDHVRIFAANDSGDPFLYANFSDGKSIDPDTTQWVAIKYRSVPANDGARIEIYAAAATAPGSHENLVSDGNWNTVVFYVADAGNWTNDDYGDKTKVRIDPLDNLEAIKDGLYIDIAWVAFFKEEDDALAYTGEQDTAECVVLPENFKDAAELKEMSGISKVDTYIYKEDVAPVDSKGNFDYAYIPVIGEDPYFYAKFNNHHEIDADNVKWVSIKYRSDAENEGNYIQIYAYPPAEPCTRFDTINSGEWETGVFKIADNTAHWNSAEYDRPSTVRIDPLNDESAVAGNCLEIAWIAFFESEEAAKAYDGTQMTPACIVLPEDISEASLSIDKNNIGEVEIFTENVQTDTDPEDTKTEDTNPEDTKPEDKPASEPKDCNNDGEIDNKDVVILFRYVSSGKKVENEVEKYDMNNDGVVDNKDVVSLFRAVSQK